MHPAGPIDASGLFLPLHTELIALLERLSPADWSQPTVAAGWDVRDMAAHLLDTDIRRLSMLRDRLAPIPPPAPITSYHELVGFLDALNAAWVAAARRISPRVLTDLLRVTGPQLAELFAGSDPLAPALGVAWAGEQQSPAWFDIAREYTEKWMHQQQIRDAVGAPGLTSRKWLAPVLDTFMRGMPHTFHAVAAAEGACLAIEISGPAGGSWALVREATQWQLYVGSPKAPAARVELGQDAAWRLFTKGLSPAAALGRAAITGDVQLGRQALELVAIMG